VINNELEKKYEIVTTTNGIYPWSSVTHKCIPYQLTKSWWLP